MKYTFPLTTGKQISDFHIKQLFENEVLIIAHNYNIWSLWRKDTNFTTDSLTPILRFNFF
jgi:hypothetical protein